MDPEQAIERIILVLTGVTAGKASHSELKKLAEDCVLDAMMCEEMDQESVGKE